MLAFTGFYLFQFTPLRKGRLIVDLRVIADNLFQFTPLRKGRRLARDRNVRKRRISIHAPTQGATAKDMRFQQIFCSTLTNHRALIATPYNLQGLS